jgi:hypothetical protein
MATTRSTRCIFCEYPSVFMLTSRAQPGVPRTDHAVLRALEEQLETSFWPGNSATVQQMQTASGTKDVTTQQWIDRAIKEVIRLRADDPTLSDEEIADKVRNWILSQPGEKFNPLLTFPGSSSLCSSMHTCLTQMQG